MTEQEAFWAGNFGDSYTERNAGDALFASNLALFARILSRTQNMTSIFEIGANRGLNLKALQALVPGLDVSAIELNSQAFAALQCISGINAEHGSILDYEPKGRFDMVFTKGVLIHLPPERLPDVYAKISQMSSRYVLFVEYYNPSPVEVQYRGHSGKLFKRDFAGEFLDLYPDFSIVDYGFRWRRDPMFPHDDTTWFLMERRS